MQKARIALLTAAVVVAACAALASSSQAPCSTQAQYFRASDGNFYPAGVEGYDFVCEWSHFSTCTYYYDQAAQQYRPCKYGKLLWLR